MPRRGDGIGATIQEHDLDPKSVTITPEFADGSVGTVRSGSDVDHASNVSKLAGRLIVDVTIGPTPASKITAALAEHGGAISK